MLKNEKIISLTHDEIIVENNIAKKEMING
jgi:hypothetical protein